MFYIGETGRKLNQRLKEHKSDINNKKEFSALATHSNLKNHTINFNSAKIIYPCSNISKRHIVESALINTNKNCFNLNKGFVPLNDYISKQIISTVNL